MRDVIKEMNELLRLSENNGDIESLHSQADELLCEVLHELGRGELVEIYNKIDKWYG